MESVLADEWECARPMSLTPLPKFGTWTLVDLPAARMAGKSNRAKQLNALVRVLVAQKSTQIFH
jgi:hypothetical protein